MNYKMMGRFVAQILSIEGVFMVPALCISLFCGETAAVRGFLYTLAVLAGIVLVLALLFGTVVGYILGRSEFERRLHDAQAQITALTAAFEEAAAILVNQYTALAGATRVESTPAPGSKQDEDDSGLMLPIEELDLSARTANALLNNDIRTIRDLVTLSETDLKDLKGFGQKALDEVKEKLTELNI